MIKSRLKEMDFKITELAEYLQITRPTLYKFIDDYDQGKFETINKRVLKLFRYIDKNPLAGKKTVLTFILTNLVVEKEMGEEDEVSKFTKIKKYILENPSSDKTAFIDLIISRKDFDTIVSFLMEIYPLLKKRKLSDEEIRKLKPYDLFMNEIEKENH